MSSLKLIRLSLLFGFLLSQVELKFNSDGVAIENLGKARYDGVFWTIRGFIKGCFVTPLSNLSFIEGKLLRVIQGLMFAKSFSWDNIWLESDSTVVMHFL